ncbi:DoxX family protein [Acinetobacter boissieri]|uniref:DoxX-like family protein n=1 Tax=Acinetobacter boissieri TaxID=1219383 RepID=A0A1G6GM36_9GAMM|nr:DoxX family protein [Acinetobacter boissieri]SDB82994.1 DoxX-like family protein [Acinetobacter boissieri]
MNHDVVSLHLVPEGKVKIFAWFLRIFLALAFISAGCAKLAGVPMMISVFDQIGIGQWFRFFTGTIEIICGIGLFIQRTTAFASTLLAITMICAVFTHLFLIGGNPAPAVILLMIAISISWLYRHSFKKLI